jgi:ribose 5-phosphate isomerase B
MTDSGSKPRIVLGADHAGFRLKESIKKYLEETGYAVDDVGTMSEESVDYPDFAASAAHRVADGKDGLGIIVCGTGIGMAIAANKVPGIRAAVVCDLNSAHLAREHNDANVLALAGRKLQNDEAMQIVREFLTTPFAGGRHQRRIDKITQLDLAREQKP